MTKQNFSCYFPTGKVIKKKELSTEFNFAKKNESSKFDKTKRKRINKPQI